MLSADYVGAHDEYQPDFIQLFAWMDGRIQICGGLAESIWRPGSCFIRYAVHLASRLILIKENHPACINSWMIMWCRRWDLNPHGVATNGF